MLIHAYDYDDEDFYDENLYGTIIEKIDHLSVNLVCPICNITHITNIIGDIPNDRKVPCYLCWWKVYCADYDSQVEDNTIPAAPTAVESKYKDDSEYYWGWDEDDYDALFRQWSGL